MIKVIPGENKKEHAGNESMLVPAAFNTLKDEVTVYPNDLVFAKVSNGTITWLNGKTVSRMIIKNSRQIAKGFVEHQLEIGETEDDGVLDKVEQVAVANRAAEVDKLIPDTTVLNKQEGNNGQEEFVLPDGVWLIHEELTDLLQGKQATVDNQLVDGLPNVFVFETGKRTPTVITLLLAEYGALLNTAADPLYDRRFNIEQMFIISDIEVSIHDEDIKTSDDAVVEAAATLAKLPGDNGMSKLKFDHQLPVGTTAIIASTGGGKSTYLRRFEDVRVNSFGEPLSDTFTRSNLRDALLTGDYLIQDSIRASIYGGQGSAMSGGLDSRVVNALAESSQIAWLTGKAYVVVINPLSTREDTLLSFVNAIVGSISAAIYSPAMEALLIKASITGDHLRDGVVFTSRWASQDKDGRVVFNRAISSDRSQVAHFLRNTEITNQTPAQIAEQHYAQLGTTSVL